MSKEILKQLVKLFTKYNKNDLNKPELILAAKQFNFIFQSFKDGSRFGVYSKSDIENHLTEVKRFRIHLQNSPDEFLSILNRNIYIDTPEYFNGMDIKTIALTDVLALHENEIAKIKQKSINNKKLIGLALVEAVRRIWVNHLRLSDKLPKTINGTNKTIIPFIDDVFIIYEYEGSAVNSYNSLMKINLNRLILLCAIK
jgi:CRISPR/Cas system CMR-associated protein Cmr1 (group 7 of RAMP superfamily)